jgi:hypothetical protein
VRRQRDATRREPAQPPASFIDLFKTGNSNKNELKLKRWPTSMERLERTSRTFDERTGLTVTPSVPLLSPFENI